MNAFPAYFPLAGRKIVIVGEGEAAAIKARLFEGSPAQVVRLSEGGEAADPQAYAGAALAFVAVADEAVAIAAAAAARTAHVPINVVDRPDLCDFYTPALIDRGDVVAAIGTGGSAPLLAGLLRGDIEARVPAGAGAVAALLGRMQGEVRAAFPDLTRRRAFLRAMIYGPAAEAAMAGDIGRAESLLRGAMTGAAAGVGAVRFVDGRGPADGLTLRAARTLGLADVLVLDDDVDAGVVALARRDAMRLAPTLATPDQLAVLAGRGLQIVRIVGVEDAGVEITALAQAGIVAEKI
jgi:precorrin-2 dehydrogenase/sirohydrochlorin ferrochelatase